MRARAVAALLSVAALAAGCGGGGEGDLTVSAASSLKNAFEAYEPDGRYSFAASNQLAAQIEGGARPDVFAAASTTLADELHRKGLVEQPMTFASNRLVVAVPQASNAIDSIDDLARPGVSVAIGARGVPVGDYAREVIGRLGGQRAEAILANVRSEEPDAASLVGKVSQGAVEAAFVYVTDVVASGGRLKAIALPDELEPSVAYAAAVVKGTERADAARRFVRGLLEPDGSNALRDAGFEPPP
jgi:molybdate transport system substrate-binding protein